MKYSQPLRCLEKEERSFVWSKPCSEAFDKLKRALASAPVLAYPNFREPILLIVDASSTGIGFTLAQMEKKWKGSSHCLQWSWFESGRAKL